MSIWRDVTHGIRGLLRARVRDGEIDAEVEHYFEETAALYRERGFSEEEARRTVRLEIGREHQAAEQMRSFGWENTATTFLSDVRFAARQLRRNPGFTIISVITLALGIGATTAIFSAIYPILLKPLPYPNAARLLMIWNSWQGARSEMAFGTYLELLQRSHSFDSMAMYEPWQPTMTGGIEPRRFEGQSVSATFFHVLGVLPRLGRDFRSSDEGPHAPMVVIVSDGLWREFFHGDPAIIGKSIKLDGYNYTVIGVMPAGFEDIFSPSAKLWVPEPYDSSQITREFNNWAWGNHIRVVGRLKPRISRADAVEELNGIAREPWPQFPRPRWASLQRGLIIDGLQDDLAHTVKPALLAVFAAVIIVLAIACVNVINLLLARSARRAGEFAVRGALGASRQRVMRQLVTESMLLSLLGGVVGIGVALAGLKVIVALSPPAMPRLEAISFDAAAFLFASGLMAVFGFAAGAVPALYISRNHLQSGLQRASRRIAGTQFWTRRLLVITEIALAMVLLVSAGLLLRSMERLLAVSPGFNPSHLLTLQVVTSGRQFLDAPGNSAGSDRRRHFFEQALDAVRRVPGVERAAFSSLLPLSDDPPVVGLYGSQFDDQDAQGGSNVYRYAVSPGYCQTMGIPLIRGRLLDERDTASAPQAALISESLARHHFGTRDPIGRRLHVGPRDRPWYTVVGVVGDVKQVSLSIDEEDAVYLSTAQTWFADDTLSFVIRARGDAAALIPAIKAAVWSVDKNQPMVRIITMDRLLAITQAQRRFILILFEAFGAVALMLAAVGLYGVLAGSVTERIHEIGVRMALGASRGNILALAMSDGIRLTLFGIAIGSVGAFAASRAITSLLFGTSALDPVSWLGMVALLAFVAGAACWVPAWRGANVDPARTLRAE